MTNYAPSWTAKDRVKAAALLELRTRQAEKAAALGAMPLADFIGETMIEVPAGDGAALVPFEVWPAQRLAIDALVRERLIVYLKARQLGLSWIVCAYALNQCATKAGRTVLMFSQGQLEANELIRRIGVLEIHHHHRSHFPDCTTDNIGERAWSNGSRVISLPATRRAGRSFTASIVVLDEFAFMQWGSELLAAVKPTIDAGGQLIIISSADGQGTAYHQFWEHAKLGANGYAPIFLPWSARPDRGPDWRDQKLLESGGDTATVYREYPANDLEAFTAAAGLVYDVWADGPDGGNVTEDAEYVEGAGPVYWAVDDGYEGKLDQRTRKFTPDSHPRVFLLVQEKADGRLDVFAESYAVKMLTETHIADVVALGYPDPDVCAIDSSAAELRGRLHAADLYTQGKPGDVEESIKVTRRMLAPDANGWRRVRVHPRCQYLRWELASYRRDDKGKPVKQHDHGPDALRYLCWTKRIEG